MITCNMIAQAVSEHYGINLGRMLGPGKDARHACARQVAWYLARELTDCSFPEIARRLGNRNHATVQHGIHVVEQRLASRPDYVSDIAKIMEALVLLDAASGTPAGGMPAEQLDIIKKAYGSLRTLALEIAQHSLRLDQQLGSAGERAARRNLDTAIINLRNHLSKEKAYA